MKDIDSYKRFPVKTRRYVYKYNIHFHPVMRVPVTQINSKERLGQFVADHFYEGEFYVMAYRRPVRKPGLRSRKYAYIQPFKIAFVKVIDVAGEQRSYIKLLYPMMTRYKWFWKGD